jgi:hypothetical protein
MHTRRREIRLPLAGTSMRRQTCFGASTVTPFSWLRAAATGTAVKTSAAAIKALIRVPLSFTQERAAAKIQRRAVCPVRPDS